MNTIEINTQLSFQQLIAIVKKLPPEQKQILNDSLWDETMPVPKEHQDIVLKRVSKSKKQPSRMLNWEEAYKTLE